MVETKPKKPKKKNTTVWLREDAIAVFDRIAKKKQRSRNYVIARILEAIAQTSEQHKELLLKQIGCRELL